MDITKAVDANGKQIEPHVKYENSFFRWGNKRSRAFGRSLILRARLPSKFQMNIKPRSERAVGIIDGLTHGE